MYFIKCLKGNIKNNVGKPESEHRDPSLQKLKSYYLLHYNEENHNIDKYMKAKANSLEK